MIAGEDLAHPDAGVEHVRVLGAAGDAESTTTPNAEIPGLVRKRRRSGLGPGQTARQTTEQERAQQFHRFPRKIVGEWKRVSGQTGDNAEKTKAVRFLRLLKETLTDLASNFFQLFLIDVEIEPVCGRERSGSPQAKS